MQKETLDYSLKIACMKYIAYNGFAISFMMFQYGTAPFAISMSILLFWEFISIFLHKQQRTIIILDHLLYIGAYVYTIVIFYLKLPYYVILNFMMVLSFLLRINWNCHSSDQHEYSTIIRFSKTFYRFSLVVSLMCVTLKLNNLIDWSWSQTFWWYWMFLSGLAGSSFTIIMIVITKLINKVYRDRNVTTLNEFKTLLWMLYISLASTLIGSIWIVNTLNILGIELQIKFGLIIFLIVVSCNIIIFTLIYLIWRENIVNFLYSLMEIPQSLDSSPNTPTKTKVQEHTKTKIFLQKLSNAYFRQILDPEGAVLKLTSQNEIETDRQTNIKKVNEIDNSQQKCLICFDKFPNAVFMKCGHGGICYQCAIQAMKKNKQCVLCRSDVQFVFELRERGNTIQVISKTRI